VRSSFAADDPRRLGFLIDDPNRVELSKSLIGTFRNCTAQSAICPNEEFWRRYAHVWELPVAMCAAAAHAAAAAAHLATAAVVLVACALVA
jgi:hypothetical protein